MRQAFQTKFMWSGQSRVTARPDIRLKMVTRLGPCFLDNSIGGWKINVLCISRLTRNGPEEDVTVR